jgi:hypothetical protein
MYEKHLGPPTTCASMAPGSQLGGKRPFVLSFMVRSSLPGAGGEPPCRKRARCGECPGVNYMLPLIINIHTTCYAFHGHLHPPILPCSPRVAVFASLVAAGAWALSVGGMTLSLSAPEVRPENPFREFNDWINDFFFSPDTKEAFVRRLGPDGAHYGLTYVRDFVSGSILYYLTAGLWHLYIYRIKGEHFFKVSQSPRRAPWAAVRCHDWPC